jgi:hypothetical protein
MKKIVLAIMFWAMLVSVFAQAPNAVLNNAIVTPVIDGVVDSIWLSAEAVPINNPFQDETPTLGNPDETYWKGLWNDNGLFILIVVKDDYFYPSYAVIPNGNSWEYDKPELFFDVNSYLYDGMGPNAGSGHYYLSPGFTDGKNDGSLFTLPNGAKYAFMVSGSDYIAEYFIPFSWIVDKDGFAIPVSAEIGFDISIIDRDPGDAQPNRAVWANTGNTDVSWNNMDNCGIIILDYYACCINPPFLEIYTEGDINKISVNDGTLKMLAHFLNLSSEMVWSVENGTGKASISTTGVLTAIQNGTVTVRLKSGNFEATPVVITISNQLPNISKTNLLKDGSFANLTPPLGDYWRSWSMMNEGTVEIVDEVCKMTTGTVGQSWELHLYQKGWKAYNVASYVIKFTAWSDVERTFDINLEDSPANNYARLGTSEDSESINGLCEWTIPVTTTPVTWTLHTTLKYLVESSEPSFIIKTANHSGSIFIDNVGLFMVDEGSLVVLDVDLPAEKLISCGKTAQLTPSVYYNGTGVPTYSWSPAEGLSNPNIANPVVTSKTDQVYTLTVTAPDVQPRVKTVSVIHILAEVNPSICLVNVDENDKNVVVIKKVDLGIIDSYLIYRESLIQTNKYDLIGEVPFSGNAVFVDTESNAKVQSNSYKVAVKDICGLESIQSTEHQTMHLTINQGIGNNWNLNWDPYSGAAISNYKIFRGTSKSNLAEIGNTSGSKFSYTDVTAPAGDVYYQINGILTNPCSTLKTTEYSSVHSNIISNVYNSSGAANSTLNKSFVYPNPAKDRLFLKSGYSLDAVLEIYSSQGRKVMSVRNPVDVDVSGISGGIYLVKLIEKGNIRVCRFVKE